MTQELQVRSLAKNEYQVRVRLPDFLGVLSVITGLFAAYRISILNGKIGTFKKRAIDVFDVTTTQRVDWKAFEKDLSSLVEKALDGELEEVRTELNLRWIESLRGYPQGYSGRLYPVELKVDQKASSRCTVIDIRSQDTPGFLYEVTNALSLLGINIWSIKVRTDEGVVHDRL